MTAKELAVKLNLSPSSVRRLLKRRGVKLSGGRYAISDNEAQTIISEYANTKNGTVGTVGTEGTEEGVFYAIQLIPSSRPFRIKLGFASVITRRLQDHRTAAPTARILHTWPCRKSWEQAAISAISAGEKRIGLSEVFEFTNLRTAFRRGEAFFALLPDPRESAG